jgi:hypothetical protein
MLIATFLDPRFKNFTNVKDGQYIIKEAIEKTKK